MSTDETSIKFYKENAAGYTAHVRDPKDSVYHSYYEKPAMYSLLPDLKGKTVLSVGCGSGEDSVHLKRQGAFKSVGIDLIEEFITIAKTSYPECDFGVMDMQKLDFSDGSFDFVYSSLAIHYIEDWNKVFKEVYRVLKPGSSFLFSCGHPVSFSMDRGETEEGYSIKKLEVKKKEDTGEFTITGDYLVKRKILNALGKNTANTWTMSVGDIAQAATNTGFLIEQIVEPRPLETLKDVEPNTYYKLSKIPEFIIFKLLKR